MKKIIVVILSVIAAVLVGVFVFYNVKNVETKTMDAAARKDLSGKFVTLTGGITHYEMGGADSAKTIVLVHGFSVPGYIWGGTYDSLVRAGFRVVRYDEFGRGSSDRPDAVYDPSFYRAQLFDLITELKLTTPVSIAGLSFGGAVVTDFVVHYPSMIDKVILVDPVYKFSRVSASETTMNYMMAIDPDKQANGQLDDFKYPDHFPDWVEQYKVQMQYKGFRHALISTIHHYHGDSIITNYRKLGKLNKKVLLIWGKEDRTVTFNFSDSLKRQLSVDFLPVEDAGHLPHLEKPALVNREIIKFLRGQS